MKRLLCHLHTMDATVRSHYGNGANRYAKLIWYSFLRPNRFVVLAADTAEFISASGRNGTAFHWAGDGELEKVRAGKDWPREFYMDKTASPSRCCLGSVEGETAYVHWVYMPGDNSRFLRIGPGAAEINNILTLPGFRGRGLCREAIAFALSELREEGVSTVYSVVHDANTPSIKALTRAGMREIGHIRALGPFNGRIDAGPLRQRASGPAREEA